MVGRNLAIGIAVAALVIGGFLGALIGHVVRDTDSGGRNGFADGRSGQMGPYGDRDQMPMEPRGQWPGSGARCPWARVASTPTATTGPAEGRTGARLPDGVDPEHAVHADHHARGRGHLSDLWVNAGSPDTGAPAACP